MKKTIFLSAVLALFIGCGGGSGGNGSTTKTPNKQIISNNTDEKNDKTAPKSEAIISTEGPAKSVAVSDNTLFVAEGKNGVEILKIGFSDSVSSELLYKIDNVDAKKVTLSKDAKTLLVEKADGKIVVVDVRDLSHPKVVGEQPKSNLDDDTTTKDGTYKYVAKGQNGMEVWDISNPSNPEKVGELKSSSCYEVVLIDDDKKALIATGSVGIKLLKLDNPKVPNPVSTYRVKGASVTGLSLNGTKDALFVATGKSGVMVFNLDMLLEKMGY
ncbi:MAG: hypothetical protein DSZ06_03355 [Sulfurospirillum sp.]|nr:MAG: hypothetical protein DSZ06_03355 [Sulfurospirillum sp.]